MTDSKRFARGTAARRGLLGAIIGFVCMLVFMFVMLAMTTTSGGNTSAAGGVPGAIVTIFTCLVAGPLYGFGFAFANWHLVMKKTAQGFVEGGSVLGIGIVLSSLTKDNKWGMFGWLYFLLRVCWHIGMCWIPGIYYGVKAIHAESKEWKESERYQPAQKTSPSRSAAQPLSARQTKLTPQKPRTVQQSQPTAQPRPTQQPSPVAQQSRSAQQPRPIQPTQGSQNPPALACTGGLYAGNNFPFTPGEEIYIGSDPEVCQIVFPQDVAWPIHCVMVYDAAANAWRVRDLSSGNTYRNGVSSMKDSQWQTLSRGTMLSIGQGKNSQRFQLS